MHNKGETGCRAPTCHCFFQFTPKTKFWSVVKIDQQCATTAGVEEQEKTTKLGSTLSALQAAASDFKRRKRRPAALIIDNADQLSRSEDILRHILFTGEAQTSHLCFAAHVGF